MLTKITITVPDLGDNRKNLEVEGALAAGEKATVTLLGIPEGTSTDGTELRLRVLGPMGEDLATHGDWTVGEDGGYTTDLDLATLQAYRLFVPPPPPPPPPNLRPVPRGYHPVRPPFAGSADVRLLVELRTDGDASMLGMRTRPLAYWPTDWQTATLIDLADGRVYSKEEVDELLAQEASARASGDAAALSAAKAHADTKYAKPAGGIPKSDLDPSVQESLSKADTALQSHQDISGKADKSTTYTKAEVDSLVSAAGGKFIVVASLPSAASADPKAVYLVPRQSGETGNVYDEYVRVEPLSGTFAWEKIGSTDIDLSAYRTATAQDAIDSVQDERLNALEPAVASALRGVDYMDQNKANAASLAPVFSEDSTYEEGDYCTYYGRLFRCTTAVTTAGAWNAASWTAVAVMEETATTTFVQTALDGKVSKTGDTMTGELTAPLVRATEALVLGPIGAHGFGSVELHEGDPTVVMNRGTFVQFARFYTRAAPTGTTFSVAYKTDLAAMAPLDSPAFTGTPTAPTANAGTNTTQIANTAFVRTELAALAAIVNAKQDTISDLATIRSGAAAGATAVQPSGLTNYVQKSQTAGLLKNDGSVDTTQYLTEAPVSSVNGQTGDVVLDADDIPFDGSSVASHISGIEHDLDGKLDAVKRNLLDYTSGTTLAPETAVYRDSLNADGTFPTVDATGITTAAAYYQFELELAVPSTVPSTITGPTGWTWIDGHGLPDPADLSGGETICISVRLDCTARTFLASVWRVA